jgi:hypothetical protein
MKGSIQLIVKKFQLTPQPAAPRPLLRNAGCRMQPLNE